MGQSEHKIPIFLSSVEVITGGNLLKLCIIRQRFPALVCWKPKLHLDVSTTESEIQSLVEIGLSIFFLLHLRPIYQATAPYHGHEIHMRGIAAQSRAFSLILAHQMFEKWSETAVFCTFLLQNVRFATAACIFSTSELQKVLPDPQFFNIFTCECRFRHRVVQFCNIRTYKSGPNTSCFVHFHFPMYLSPQRCVIFRHLNVQKCFKHLMFCAFSLPHVLFATAAHNFATF